MAHNCTPADTASAYAREALPKVEFFCDAGAVGRCTLKPESLPPLSRAIINEIPTSESDYARVLDTEAAICRSIQEENAGVPGIRCPTIFKELKDLPQVAFIRAYSVLADRYLGYPFGTRAQEVLKRLDQALPQAENAIPTLTCDPKFQGQATQRATILKKDWKEKLTERFAKIEVAQYEGEISPDFPEPKYSLGNGLDYVCSEFGCVEHTYQTTSGKGLAELKRQHPEAYEQAVAPLVSFGQKLGVDFSNHSWEYHLITPTPRSEEPPSGKQIDSGCEGLWRSF